MLAQHPAAQLKEGVFVSKKGAQKNEALSPEAALVRFI